MTKCPICGKTSSNKKNLLEHVEHSHKDEIPQNMSAAQYVYSLNHDGRDYGICRVCGNPTPWNEKTGKPKQICGSKSCKEKIAKEFEINLKSKLNMTRQDLMNNPDHQEQMLANRKISGIYKWSDNKHTFKYTGSYEKFALEWLDKVMDIDPDTIQTPGPKIQYIFEGKPHYWITDMYLTEYNLVIEIKDGGKTGDKNTHPGFAHNRELEKAKDDYMKFQNQYNYLKLTNKNMMQLVKVLSEIRLNNIFDQDKNIKKESPIIDINESCDNSYMTRSFNFPNFICDKLKGKSEFEIRKAISEEITPFGSEITLNKYLTEDGRYSDEPDLDLARKIIGPMAKKLLQTKNPKIRKLNKRLKNRMTPMTESTSEILNESVIISGDDISYNLDEWKSGKSNLLVVIGLSGSGKSTLAKQLASQYHADYTCIDEMDIREEYRRWGDKNDRDKSIEKASTIIDAFLSSHKEDRNKLMSELNTKEFIAIQDKFIRFAIRYASSYKDQKFILEGIQLIDEYWLNEVFSGRPLIIKGASVLKSIARQIKRWNSYGEGLKHILKYLPSSIRGAFRLEKRLNYLKKAIDQLPEMNDKKPLNEQCNYSKMISNDDIDALCEGTYAYNEPESKGVLEEVSFPFFLSNKDIDRSSKSLFRRNKSNLPNNSFSTYDIKKNSWKDILFHKNNFTKKVTSTFHRVEINPTNHTIEIRGINYRKLVQHIKDLYPDQKVFKIFEIIYNSKDWDKYKEKRINKNDVRIEYIQTYEFFALELSILFKELYERYDLKYYNDICVELYKKTWLSNSDIIKPESIDINRLRLLDPQYELKFYQKEFIESYPILKSRLNLNGYILSFDQGLGKTLTSVALALCLHKEKVYIVCPNALKENWAIEIKSYLPRYQNEELWKEEVFIHGISKTFDMNKAKFIIVNQESIPKIFDKIDSKSRNMLVIDESHNFRNIDSARSQYLIKLKDMLNTKDVLVMSGTPIKASPNEICPVMRLIDPLFTNEVASIYNKCFNLNSIAASSLIQVRFGKVMYRKTKDEVLKLPKKKIDVLKLKVSNEKRYYVNEIRTLVKFRAKELFKIEYKDYETMRQEFHNIINKYSTSSKSDIDKYLTIIDENRANYELHEMDVLFKQTYLDKYVYPSITPNDKERLDYLLVRFVNMWQHCIGVALGEILHPRRKELFIKLYDENKAIINNMIFDNKKKTVIFTPIVEVANHIHKSLGEAGLASVLVTGKVKDKLTPILRFKEDSNIDVLVATSQTLGTGVTLTEASLMFFFGTPWRSTDFDQCCDRIYRIGQTEDVFIFNVLMDSKEMNLSTRIQKILNWSNEMFDAMITSNDGESLNEGSNKDYETKVFDMDKFIKTKLKKKDLTTISINVKRDIVNQGSLIRLYDKLTTDGVYKSNPDYENARIIVKQLLDDYKSKNQNKSINESYDGKIKIGIDFDDTLTEFHQMIIEQGLDWCRKNNINVDKVHYDMGSPKDIFELNDEQYEKFKQEVSENENRYINEPIAKYCSETMNYLNDKYEIYIVTARNPENNPNIREYTFNWLNKHNIPYNQVCFAVDDKGEFCKKNDIKILIDDNLNFINTCINYGIIPICPAKPYNISAKYNTKCYYCDTWLDIKNTIDKIVEEDNWSNESVMSIANLSPIMSSGLFEELQPNDTNEDLEKELDNLKKILNESVSDKLDPNDYCIESINTDENVLLNRVKSDIVNNSCVNEYRNSHYGTLWISSDFHIFGVVDKEDNNNNPTNIQQVNKIIDDINSTVNEDDTFIICGDLGYKLDDCLEQHTKYFLSAIKCKHIWLVLGNHDLLTNDKYKEFGCEVVCNRLEYNGWTFTHCPINNAKFNIHGHIHDMNIDTDETYKVLTRNNRFNSFYYTSGITNVQNVINKYLNDNMILEESSLKDSDVMFGNGEFSAITDNRFVDFSTGDQNEDIDPYTAMFSPNNDKPVPDYMDASNNFETNEDVNIDMEIDPSITTPNDLSSIAQSIYNSNFG